ncbi:protein canopy homolog 4-like isoform X2 [Acanthaster planci]|uniref:Protein canopy homolog 4-like isoform X2 n=1 Tax=Acanthaster planci TaxID=133434 RepID=A0A8B7YH02_ACAPL|nr:protein canopy homolog 4-like isoform X2 [Acanthaster planci]
MLRPYVIISADSEVYVNHPALQSQAETATLILFCFLILSSNVKKMFEISTGRLMAVFLVLLLAWHSHSGDLDPEDESNPHRDPSKCEVCKFVAQELQETMTETGKKKEVLQIGHQFDKQKKEIKYHKSELRLIEALDDVCERILQYNIHAERASSRRFAKGQSETMQTLRGLQAKGVKVDLGMPDDMWEKPSAPVTKMKQRCEQLIEEQEDAIGNWFFKTNQETTLLDYLCVQRVLTKDEHGCLNEVWTGSEKVNYDTQPSEGVDTPDAATPPSATESLPAPKKTKAKPTVKKTRSRKKVKAGKRGKGKKTRSTSKVKSAAKSSKTKKKKDEL